MTDQKNASPETLTAPWLAGTSWRLGPRPSPLKLPISHRMTVAERWLFQGGVGIQLARWYTGLALALMRFAAGPNLLRIGHEVAEERLALARRCFTLAAGYSGLERDPNPAAAAAWPIPQEPRPLAESLVVRGLVYETYRQQWAAAAGSGVEDMAVAEYLRLQRQVASQACALHWGALELLRSRLGERLTTGLTLDNEPTTAQLSELIWCEPDTTDSRFSLPDSASQLSQSMVDVRSELEAWVQTPLGAMVIED